MVEVSTTLRSHPGGLHTNDTSVSRTREVIVSLPYPSKVCHFRLSTGKFSDHLRTESGCWSGPGPPDVVLYPFVKAVREMDPNVGQRSNDLI